MSTYISDFPNATPAKSVSRGELQIFATSPQSLDWQPAVYRDRVIDVARWSERAGCTGTLIYTDIRLLIPG